MFSIDKDGEVKDDNVPEKKSPIDRIITQSKEWFEKTLESNPYDNI